jgi:hypothetical protein
MPGDGRHGRGHGVPPQRDGLARRQGHPGARQRHAHRDHHADRQGARQRHRHHDAEPLPAGRLHVRHVYRDPGRHHADAVKGTATITACAAAGTTATLDTAITAADGDFVVMAQTPTGNSYNKEPEGILAGADDGTYVATYHNLARATYSIINSYVLTSVGPALARRDAAAVDAQSIRVGKGVDVLGCEHAVRRAYLALLEPDRRYTGADLSSPDGGTKAAKKPTGKVITFGDIPFLIDRDAPFGMIVGLNKESWVRYVELEGEWANNEGSVLKWVPGYDEYTAFYRIFENYHCHMPARNFRMEGITVNQIAVRSF